MRIDRVGLLLVLLFAACAASRHPVAGGDRSANVGGTISGIVRAATGDTPLSGRKITAVNVETGQRIETSTGMNGGYTMKVSPGHYRVEVELRAGETLSAAPDEVHITTSDMDAGRNFVITIKPVR